MHEPTPEGCWTFRGYRLDPAQFSSALIHLYRGEVSRANTWRMRLDATTNWAVITVGAALTFAFGSPDNPHFVLLLVLLLVLTFLYIEARRYRYYELWYYRVHLMETDFFAAMLVSPFRPSPDWADDLAQSLLHPTFPITWWEAVGRRFRRNYVWLITLLLVSWAAKLALHPQPAADLAAVLDRAALGRISGPWVIGAFALLYVGLIALALAAALARARLKTPVGAPQWLRESLRRVARPLWLGRRSAQEHLATIITADGEQLGRRILMELGRGVTAMKATGMYTGQARDVLMCAVTELQVRRLEEIVARTDPDAFVIVSAAVEVRGRRFRSFEAPS